jgi:nicotinate-nucleotide pyrophosphorylase (carboxylating)
MNDSAFETLLDLAVREDLGDSGDVTSEAVFEGQTTVAVLKSKDSGVLAGEAYFSRCFARIDPETRVDFSVHDGAVLFPGDTVATVSGKVKSVLEAERISINFLSFLSGIASQTRLFVEAAAAAGKTAILDTRKTLPGYRVMSKYAVTVGGGRNHRMGLYDMVLIKDNHIDAAGSITRAVSLVRAKWGSRFRIEVECRNLAEVREALASAVDVIMLDNMAPGPCREAVGLGSGSVAFEASGNMSLERIAEYSAIGVDYISIGKLTHSVTAFDFSLQIRKG